MRGPLNGDCAGSPKRSARIYLRLAPADIAFCKFIFEGYDNLAYLSVIDKYEAVARLTFSPDQREEVREFVDALAGELDLRIIEPPADEKPPGRP